MPVQVAASGIDWLTFTTRPGGSTDILMDLGEMLCGVLEEQKGHTRKKGSLLGYVGHTCGQLFVGCRDDGGILRASGGTAPYVIDTITRENIRGRTTRIDYAVTVRFDSDREEYARTTAEEITAPGARSAQGRPASVALHRGFGGGDTCTIGARSSQRYLRLYDKTREQRGEVEPNLWRFEVEYKSPLSQFMFESYQKAAEPERMIMQRVRAEFEYQAVAIPWSDDQELQRAKVATDKTSIERKLAWLRDQVAPSIRWLEREGYGEEARTMLGLHCPDK